MIYSKRGQGLSFNTIILAVIALVALIVIITIFTNKVGFFSKGANEATSCNQLCQLRGYDIGASSSKSGDTEAVPGGYTADNKVFGLKDNEERQCYCKNT